MTIEITTELMLNPNDPREREIMIVERDFALVQRKASVFSASDMVPKAYQNKIANCIIAMEMAERLNTGVMEIMQNLYIVHGNPSFSSKYLIAMINMSNILKGRLRFVMVGDNGTDSYGCFAVGTEAETGNDLVGTTITIGMAKKQGWYGKTGSKWPDLTDQMLQYRAAAFWSRINAPEATMGMMTTEERQDTTELDITPKKAEIGSVADMIEAKREQVIEQTVVKQEPVIEQTVVEEPAEVWPKVVDSIWTDSSGAQFDESFVWVAGQPHPPVKKDGTFMLAAKKRPAKQVQKEEPANQPTIFEVLSKQIAVCTCDDDFVPILKQNAWSKLKEGQAQELQAMIDDKKMDLALDL